MEITEKSISSKELKITENRPKPFIKWVGGKRQLLSQFREMKLYPPEKYNKKTNTNGKNYFD